LFQEQQDVERGDGPGLAGAGARLDQGEAEGIDVLQVKVFHECHVPGSRERAKE